MYFTDQGVYVSLEIYARCEHLLGIDEATQHLHALFEERLSNLTFETLLDIGCGKGGWLSRMQANGKKAVGIDLSETMVESARSLGLDARCENVCDHKGQYDVATAVFDVLNFIPEEQIEGFFECVASVLKPGGYFLADVNTLHGFANVAEGTMSTEDEETFLNVDAVFEENRLYTQFTLFEKGDGECWRKEQGSVVQQFYALKFFRKLKSLRLIENSSISLYDKEDKMMLLFKKDEE